MNMPNYGIVKKTAKTNKAKTKTYKRRTTHTVNKAKEKRRVDKRGKECQGEIKRRKGILVGRAASPLSKDIFALLRF